MPKSGRAKPAIVVKSIYKNFDKVKVLKGINFSVEPGSIFALLGPNGAGKTTTIKILSTLLEADKGKAVINGYDVASQPAEVKASIGLTGQYAAVDEYLTAEENLIMIGRLYRLSIKDTKRRAKELIKLFDLESAANRPVRTYSGGMKRRIDLAMSLIASPPVIFLDEPTTGLDPRSRLTMWDIIKKLAKSGTTILLTTQYMDEADQLADKIVVIDGGKVIAEGTADTLKSKVGADRLEIVVSRKSNFEKAHGVLKGQRAHIDKDRRMLSVASKGGTAKIKQILQKLEDARIEVDSFSLHRPTLDDVFMTLTGHVATKETENQTGKPKGKK